MSAEKERQTQNDGSTSANEAVKIREGLRNIFDMIDQLDREEGERLRSGLSPLFGLGEPVLAVRRDLGATIETTPDENLVEKETQYLATIHTLLSLMRQTRGQTPEDTESLERIVNHFSIGIERIEASRRPDNTERVDAVVNDLRHIVKGLRRRIELLADYHGVPMPE